jgi:hypothetical protein
MNAKKPKTSIIQKWRQRTADIKQMRENFKQHQVESGRVVSNDYMKWSRKKLEEHDMWIKNDPEYVEEGKRMQKIIWQHQKQTGRIVGTDIMTRKELYNTSKWIKNEPKSTIS